ncbi:MAG: Kojibiose phosphorylase [uncultured bacterium]|nr:MAG: Kojibiose phosphorylase [uncultured bacterium]
MQREAPAEYQLVISKTGVKPEELEQWKKMAPKMRILKDESSGVFEQHAGYFDLPHVDIQKMSIDQIPIYKNWAYVKIFRHNMIKQPDVLNLMYFYSQDYTLEEKRANYEFYEARTIHESSLSPSLHAILAAELGKMDEAYKFFAYGARLDLDDYNRNTEQGLHVTSAAGVWASMIFGFGGMRTDGDVLIFNPTIPGQWKSYRFRVYYQGAKIQVIVDQENIHFQVINGPSVTISIYETNHTLSTERLALKLRKVN